MDCRVISVLLYTIMACYSQECSTTLDANECSYTLSCDNSFITDVGWDEFTFDRFVQYHYGYHRAADYTDSCTNFVVYGPNKFFCIYLVLNFNGNTTMLIPNYRDWNSEQLLNIIYSLDIKFNGYTEPPVIRSMQNLAILDVSWNHLSTAVLTNENELPVLTEIDFSHNRINKIELRSSQHVFKKLTKINLSYNSLQKLPDNIFENFKYLEILDLSYNGIKLLSQFTFKGVTKLSNLNLSNNKITGINSYLFKDTSINLISFSKNILEGSLASGMFEGLNVTSLDFSNQLLTGVKDFAFQGLVELNTLLLNLNTIQYLSNMCFKTLINLRHLDLSNNHITSIDFNTEDLGSLQSLLLKNNRLTHIKKEQLLHLSNLELLDISENQITRIEPKSFHYLSSLVNFKIHDIALVGSIETNEFDGLASIFSLDLSGYILTSVQNASFNGMINLKEVNLTTCHIGDLQYNVFSHTGKIETLDLSFNKLQEFAVNTTELNNLVILLLNNNLIKTIASDSFRFLIQLNKIILSHNTIEYVHNNSFSNLNNLRYLDLSDNTKIQLPEGILYKPGNLEIVLISGIENAVKFTSPDSIEISSITHLVLSHASVQNISELYLGQMIHLNDWDLSNNNISYLKIGDFAELTKLTFLDLSFNKISFIQPSVFAHNNYLKTLNISHNMLSSISYGMFFGLANMHIVDMSFNNLKKLQGEMFIDLNLEKLIVDHNKIETVDVIEFNGVRLETLSIGNNPIPCQLLVQLDRANKHFKITAIEIEKHHENFRGVTCNRRHTSEPEIIPNIPDKPAYCNDTHTFLTMLFNSTNRKAEQETNITQYLEKLTNILENTNSGYEEKFNVLVNLTSTGNLIKNNFTVILNHTNIMLSNSNVLLNKIVKLVQQASTAVKSTEKDVKFTDMPSMGNDSDVINSIEKTKEDIDDPKFDNQDNLINASVSDLPSEPLSSNDHSKLVSNDKSTKITYTEICVSVILMIVVGVILYKAYKFRMIIRNRLFASSHELPDLTENSSL